MRSHGQSTAFLVYFYILTQSQSFICYNLNLNKGCFLKWGCKTVKVVSYLVYESCTVYIIYNTLTED